MDAVDLEDDISGNITSSNTQMVLGYDALGNPYIEFTDFDDSQFCTDSN